MSKKHFSITVEINAPPNRVWDVMSDFRRWPEWTPSVTNIDALTEGPLVVGKRFRIRQPKVPPAVWRLTALETCRGFTWKTGSPIAWAIARHSVAAEGGGSRAMLSIEYGGLFGGIVARLTRSINDKYLAFEAAGLKRRSESMSSKVA
jgi:hypothetical protein